MQRILLNFVRILFIAFVFLSACEQKKISIGECIQPVVTWEFPVMATMPVDALSKPGKEVEPSGNWKAVADLPKDYLLVHSIVVRGLDEIWIRGDYTILRFYTNTRTWAVYKEIDNMSVIPKHLYAARDGTLWGIGVVSETGLQSENYPLLSRYDEVTDQFRFINDQGNSLFSDMSIIDWSGSTKGQNELLWMILARKSDGLNAYHSMLYSFDLASLQSNSYDVVKNGPLLSTLAIASDGKIWASDLYQLIIFDPEVETTKIFKGNRQALDDMANEDVLGSHFLYFDRMGRLWIDDRGWLDLTISDAPIWHKVIRSSVFITGSASPENQYGWSWPTQMHQSSDDLYWFSSSAGMVNLDPQTGEWCKFTTGSSPIAEDSQGNLWIAVYGKLYRYQLSR